MTHSIPLTLTSSGEIDRPTYGSGTLERAGVKLSANVQMTHLKQKGKEKAVGTEILVLVFNWSVDRFAAISPGEAWDR